MKRVAVVLLLICAAGVTANATPPPPTGAHPRMILDATLRAAWKQQAAAGVGPVKASIDICDSAAHTGSRWQESDYQRTRWRSTTEACLVAWAATDKDEYAQTAIKFMTALLDDFDKLGDGKGGDDAVLQDDGYAIRNMGAATAFAYDWLYDKLTPAQRDHARARWAAWLPKWLAKGYRSHAPESNYHAGFVIASTAIAIAEAGEAGPEGDAEWARVADEVWGKELAGALAPHGILQGGDWLEGWQYAPFSVAEYALGARLMRGAGVKIDGVEAWLHSVLQRHVYALSPAEQTFAGGDVDFTSANVPVYVITLDAVALGDASADDKRFARGELARMKLTDDQYLLYDALATVGDKPVYVPRDKWPTWYVAENTQTLYVHTRWDDRAVWFVAQCAPEFDMDHRHSDAGNFVVSRGKDDVVVDPSPYPSFSSFTSNAPAVRSPHLPADLQPSQGPYGGASWSYAAQTASGVVAARCDYTNRFKYHETASDVPEALRDLVLLPSADGTSATVIVYDRATTGGTDRDLYVRVRTPGKLELAGGPDKATATVGGSRLTVSSVARSSGTPALATPGDKDCNKQTRGGCDGARFPVTEYKLELAGGSPRSVMAVGVSDNGAGDAGAQATPIGSASAGWQGVRVTGTRDAVVVWPAALDAKTLEYTAPKATAMTHVVIDPPAIDDRAVVTAKPSGDGCAIEIHGDNAATAWTAHPLVFVVDGNCVATLDKAAAAAPSAANTKAPRAAGHSPRKGCCDAGGANAPASAALALGLLGVVRRRRGRAPI
nr:hypothetical protein [Kofleriaceae bacterium]